MEGKDIQILPEGVIQILISILGRKNLRIYLEFYIQSKVH